MNVGKRWSKALLLAVGLILGPAFLVSGVRDDWRIWFLAVLAVILIGSQPNFRHTKATSTDSTPEDRGSLVLLLAMSYVILFASYGSFLWITYAKGISPYNQAASIIAGTIMTFGIVFRIIAICTLGRWFTVAVRIQDEQKLIQHGLYRWIRHPSYTGAILFWAFLPVQVFF